MIGPQRWEPENTALGYNMRPCDDGSFVISDAYDRDVNELRAEVDELRTALGEIAWSNDNKWKSDRAMAALATAHIQLQDMDSGNGQ